MWANFRYWNKKEVDKCYEERKNLKQENENLKKEIKEYQENIKNLNKELESAHREIAEKNKYLSEDKVIIERLYEVKLLSDKISKTLIDYDKDTIQHLLKEYIWEDDKEDENKNDKEEYHKKLWW